MLINCNLIEFFKVSDDWIDVCYDNEYIQSIKPYSKNKIFNIYCASDKLLTMRNCDVIYLQNLYSQSSEFEFERVREKLNKKLLTFRIP